MTSALALSTMSVHAQDRQMIFPLVVNEVPRGEVKALMRGEDVFLTVDDLEGSGLAGSIWQRVLNVGRLTGGVARIGEQEAVSLRSMAPWVSYAIDEESLALSVTVRPELLSTTHLSAAPPRPENIIYSRDFTAFLNYAADSSASNLTSAFAETGLNYRGRLLFSSFSRGGDGDIRRGVTHLTFDDRPKLRRWTIGDATAFSDSLGGSVALAGITVSRNFELDPYFVRYPGMTFRGAVGTPSRVDVYVNGILVAQRDVPPGPFDLRDIPVTAGAGTTRVVVRDAFGREQVTSASFYSSTGILARGLSEYLYSAGAIRNAAEPSDFGYGQPALVGFHRFGVTEWWTAGGRVEATRNIWSAGPSVSTRTRLGEFDLTLGASGDHGRMGSAAQGAYRFNSKRVGFGAALRHQSREYAHLSLRATADRPVFDSLAYVAWLTRRGSVGLQWNTSEMRDSENMARLALTSSLNLTRAASLFVSAGGVEDATGRHAEIFAGLSLMAGTSGSVNFGVSRAGSANDASIEIQKSLPLGEGFGYRILTAGNGSGVNGSAALQYQNRYGRYEMRFDPYHLDERPSLSAAGAVVYGGGSLLFSRPVQDSFAIVRVPGVPNVRVYSNNLPVGRTNGSGTALVPSMLSYYGNRVQIEDRDVPLDYEVADVERIIAPPYRGGAVVDFPVRQVRTVGGAVIVLDAGNETIPAFGQITLKRDGSSFESPLGRGGEFYFENIGAGTYDALIEYGQGGTCSFRIEIPAGKESAVKLPRQTCSSGETTP